MDCQIIETVSEGYSLELQCNPRNHFWRIPKSRDPVKHAKMKEAIQHLLHIKAIESVPSSQRRKGVYSIFFLVPKKDKKMRAILDLKWLNTSSKWRHGGPSWPHWTKGTY